MNNQAHNYLYYSHDDNQAGIINNDRLTQFSERHQINIAIPKLKPCNDIVHAIKQHDCAGVVIAINGGAPHKKYLELAKTIQQQQLQLWFYWPQEEAIEVIDKERLDTYQQIWLFLCFLKISRNFFWLRHINKLFYLHSYKAAAHKAFWLTKFMLRKSLNILPANLRTTLLRKFKQPNAEIAKDLAELLSSCSPIPLQATEAKKGVYLRLDFWAKLTAGGSYSHTCYVAKELQKHCAELTVFIGSRFKMLDDMNIKQVVLKNLKSQAESKLLLANSHYYTKLKSELAAIAPAFIYERICLGNYLGAYLSKELNIPYIVEYNGSELTMQRSFNNHTYTNEQLFLDAEMAAFKQASAINVVSDVVALELIERGVSSEKILVNPNGADPDIFKPITTAAKAQNKLALGWQANDIVIGFTGTFGAWHGIDVLADLIPNICQQHTHVKFLLIGDGSLRHLIDAAIAKHKLDDQVHITGLIAPDKALHHLQTCDIFLCPHATHMQSTKFFGSPTKLFEYMALGTGIIASDLMQIGNVLRPALFADNLSSTTTVDQQRAILCQPGNRKHFISAIEFLINHQTICEQLGKNARQAVLTTYSWQHHVTRLWNFLYRKEPSKYLLPDVLSKSYLSKIHTLLPIDQRQTLLVDVDQKNELADDHYKHQVQAQWDNNPCGSQYVNGIELYTLPWFEEVERYRYQEYGPWLLHDMEFDQHAGEKVLEVGGGIGTDLAQFAKHGALVTDLDLSSGHLAHAKTNFKLRNLTGEFHHGDAENMPFADNTFDVVYSNGVIHHSPNTAKIVKEMYRVLKPGGKVIIMVYAQNSYHFWKNLVGVEWFEKKLTNNYSIGEIMSRRVELAENDARPLVKVYSKRRLRGLFSDFDNIHIIQRQLMRAELPRILRWLPINLLGKCCGWNLVIKATKPIS